MVKKIHTHDMGQGGDFLQRKKYDLDAWHGYDKKPPCKRWHDSFFSGKNGVFLGGSPFLDTIETSQPIAI